SCARITTRWSPAGVALVTPKVTVKATGLPGTTGDWPAGEAETVTSVGSTTRDKRAGATPMFDTVMVALAVRFHVALPPLLSICATRVGPRRASTSRARRRGMEGGLLRSRGLEPWGAPHTTRKDACPWADSVASVA